MENVRVLACAEALRGNALSTVGELLRQSHISLRDDYEVSCDELDVMVELALQQKGVIGARMTGAGFGGCTVNLVEKDHAESFAPALADAYRNTTDITPAIYLSEPAAGAQLI
jgi:galactokinase